VLAVAPPLLLLLWLASARKLYAHCAPFPLLVVDLDRERPTLETNVTRTAL